MPYTKEAKECKHLEAFVRGFDTFGILHCPTCDSSVRVGVVINNLLSAMREALKEVKNENQ